MSVHSTSTSRGAAEDSLAIDRQDETSAPSSESEKDVSNIESQEPAEAPGFRRGFRFWAVIVGLAIAQFQASLEHSVVVTSGPTIVDDLQMGEEYIWITNAFFVCSAALQPLLGQFCNVFGRRWLMLLVTALFMLGSGICGGATSGAMLIAGRAVQGAGSGGIIMIVEIVLGDMVPLRQRGNYLAVILAVYTVGMTLGPFIGGAIVETTTWRWVFYINLPIGGVALVVLYLFLHVNYNKSETVMQKLRRIDWVGNGVLMAGTIAMLYALAYAGGKYAWTAWQVLFPLILGFVLIVICAIWETYGPAAEPVIPPKLLKHRTSLIVAITTFLHSILVFWILYFLPISFQAVLLFSPERTGVALLPLTLIALPGAALSAMAVSRWGKFKMLHLVGFAIFTLGFGLYSMQWEGTTTAEWATFQSISALGGGIVLDTLLPAFQAPVPESDQAATTATWCFIRTVGNVWGVAIPATIFNNRINQLTHTISDPAAASLLYGGGAYQHASASFINSFDEPIRGEIRAVYREALKLTFLIGVAFGGLACLLTILEKEIKLRKDLETEYGLKDSSKERKEGEVDAQAPERQTTS
ncbi:MFS general substrate transporter [Hypoxylon rubiginosum]|uniref:MFS general substrate transporter n=1 Tax=Hypoxylon rubiginosum TaxID=110542 RepID=A0ACB9YW16_9PEZI|nr:MFS general substrate transporter [Hypoxylon rubiginosum]